VSIVLAILLMTLTLASTQFSPRILISFIRDRVTQWTLTTGFATASARGYIRRRRQSRPSRGISGGANPRLV
jgi:uncharacterized membrane protein